MDKMRQLALLTVVAVVAVVAGGWFLLVSPQRSKVDDLHHQAGEQQQQNADLASQIARLKAEAKDLPAEQARLAAVAEQLPPNPSMPSLVNDLSTAAKKSGVDLQVIAPETPVAFGSTTSVRVDQPSTTLPGTTSSTTSGTTSSTTPSSTTTTAPSSTGTSTSTSSTSTSSTSTSTTSTTSGSTSGTTGTATAPGSTTLSGLPGQPVGGLYQIPMSVTVVGTYYQLTQFVNQLENLHRAYLVTGLDLKPGDPLAAALSAGTGTTGGTAVDQGYSGALTATVDGFVFEVLAQDPATATATLPTAPSAAPSGH